MIRPERRNVFGCLEVSLISNCFFGAGFRVADINRGSVKPQNSTELGLIFQNNHDLEVRLERERRYLGNQEYVVILKGRKKVREKRNKKKIQKIKGNF